MKNSVIGIAALLLSVALAGCGGSGGSAGIASKVPTDLAGARQQAQDCAVDAAEQSGDAAAVSTARGGSLVTLSADKAELTVVVITQISGLEKAATAAIGCANKALGIDAPNLVDQVLSTEATSATQRQSFSDRGVRVEWWPQARGVTFDTYVKWQLVSS